MRRNMAHTPSRQQQAGLLNPATVRSLHEASGAKSQLTTACTQLQLRASTTLRTKGSLRSCKECFPHTLPGHWCWQKVWQQQRWWQHVVACVVCACAYAGLLHSPRSAETRRTQQENSPKQKQRRQKRNKLFRTQPETVAP